MHVYLRKGEQLEWRVEPLSRTDQPTCGMLAEDGAATTAALPDGLMGAEVSFIAPCGLACRAARLRGGGVRADGAGWVLSCNWKELPFDQGSDQVIIIMIIIIASRDDESLPASWHWWLMAGGWC